MRDEAENAVPAQPAPAPARPQEPETTREPFSFTYNEAAYNQLLGLIHWNDPELWLRSPQEK